MVITYKVSDSSKDKDNVKKYKKRKRCKIRTRGSRPWWWSRATNRKAPRLINRLRLKGINKTEKTKGFVKAYSLLLEKFIKKNHVIRNEKNFRSKSKVKKEMRWKNKFEFSRITKGFKKRKYYNGKRYKENKYASPIFSYRALLTLFVPNRNIPRFRYLNHIGDQTRNYLVSKKGAWEKKEIRPSIFFKQFFKILHRMETAGKNIEKYEFITNLKCSTKKLIERNNWNEVDTKYPRKNVFNKMGWKIRRAAKKKYLKGRFQRYMITNKFRFSSIIRKWWERIAIIRAFILRKKQRRKWIKNKNKKKKRWKKKKKRSYYAINFTDIGKQNKINFYKIYHQYYNEKKNVLSIYSKKNKYTFPRIKEYRIPSIFRFMNKRFKIKIGVKKVKNFYNEFFSIRNWYNEKKEFFYAHYRINRIQDTTENFEKINCNTFVLENLINNFHKSYFENIIASYSKRKYWPIEEQNLMKERNLESYLSYKATEIWENNKKLFKVHRLRKATRNKKYRKLAFRPKKPKKKLKILKFRTFIGDESFRQRRYNTNWHNKIEKWGKTPMTRFFSRHELTSRFPKNHKIFKNQLRWISIDSDDWSTKEWLGCFHYLNRRIKKRRKKIMTKIYFRKERTSTTRDAKVNLAKGTITYAKKTRTYHGRRLKPRFRWKKTWYRRYIKNTVKRWVFFSNTITNN